MTQRKASLRVAQKKYIFDQDGIVFVDPAGDRRVSMQEVADTIKTNGTIIKSAEILGVPRNKLAKFAKTYNLTAPNRPTGRSEDQVRELVAEGLTLEAIGQALGGITRERARQLIKAFGLTEEHKKARQAQIEREANERRERELQAILEAGKATTPYQRRLANEELGGMIRVADNGQRTARYTDEEMVYCLREASKMLEGKPLSCKLYESIRIYKDLGPKRPWPSDQTIARRWGNSFTQACENAGVVSAERLRAAEDYESAWTDEDIDHILRTYARIAISRGETPNTPGVRAWLASYRSHVPPRKLKMASGRMKELPSDALIRIRVPSMREIFNQEMQLARERLLTERVMPARQHRKVRSQAR